MHNQICFNSTATFWDQQKLSRSFKAHFTIVLPAKSVAKQSFENFNSFIFDYKERKSTR